MGSTADKETIRRSRVVKTSGAPSGDSRISLKITFLYALAGGLWILFSDLAVSLLSKDPSMVTRLQTLKGWLFIIATSLMLYLLIERNLAGIRRSEQALRESEEKFRMLIESTASSIFIYRDRILEVNHAMEVLTGYGREDLLKMNFYDIVHPDFRETIREHCEAFPKGEAAPLRCEYKIARKDGEERWIDFTSSIIKYNGERSGLGTAFDITERKTAEEALKKSEKNYRFVVDNALVGIYTSTVKGEFLYANEAFVKMAEFDSLEEFMSENVLARYKDPKKREVLIETLKKTGKVNNYEIEMLTKTGKERNIVVNVVLEGDIISGIVMDITERKQAEEALRHSEERFRLLVEKVTDYEIFMLDSDGYIVSWNVGAELNKGYRPEEIIGKHHSIFFIPEDIKRGIPEQELLVAAMADRFEDEGWRARKDGSLFWANVVTTALRNKEGDLRGYVKVVKDITERKKTEEALRESEERHRIIAETAADAIITIDEESRILFVNPAVEKIFGHGADEIIGRPLTILMPERLRNSHLSGIRRYLETGEKRIKWKAVELPGLHRSGYEIPLEISYGEFIKDGSHFFIGIVRDITERKELEKEKEYKDMLERFALELETLVAERTMGLVALKLADRVRTPAAVIGLTGKKIIEKKDVSEKARGDLGMIVEEAGKLEGIVKDFQGMVTAKKSVFRYEDINEVVRGVLPIAEREAAGKGIRLVVGLSERPLKINAQRDLLRIAIYNLIKNAVEATPEAGRITIETSADADNVVLTITDTGSGIPAEYIDKIFDPFFSTKEYRYGMGLPLVKQIATEHFGEMEVKSEVGVGTTFRLLLPVRWTEGTEKKGGLAQS